MKTYWKMPRGLKLAYDTELTAYRQSLLSNQLQTSWRHLERAHILGQPWAVEHTHIHWLMLKFGFRIKNGREIVGQIPRLLFGGVKSFIGKIPAGNTGGANVPPLRPMEMPEDIKALMRTYVEM